MGQQQTTAPTFLCAHCGRSFTWKAEQAGKKGKCSCGQVLAIPATPPAVLPPVEEEIDFDRLYDIAVPAPDEKPVAPAPPAMPAYIPPPRSVAQSMALERAQREKTSFEEAMSSKPRDLYAPAALLTIGAVAVCLWAFTYNKPPRSVDPPSAGFALAAIAIVILKTVALTALMVYIAPPLGFSFGLLRTAAFKLAGIFVFADALLAWTDVYMRYNGSVPDSTGSLSFWIIFIRVVVCAAVIAILLHYLFGLEREEMAFVAFPLAALSQGLAFALALGVAAMLPPQSQQNAPPTPAATQSVSPSLE